MASWKKTPCCEDLGRGEAAGRGGATSHLFPHGEEENKGSPSHGLRKKMEARKKKRDIFKNE